MPAEVRIERCATQVSAEHRVGALGVLGFEACWSRDGAILNKVTVDNKNAPGPSQQEVFASPFVVVAIRCT